MKTSKVYGRKSIIASLFFSSLFISSNASAQFIGWTPANVAVPLSTTSTILLGLLLLAFGVFIAPKMQSSKRKLFVISTGLALTLGITMNTVNNKVFAVAPPPALIVLPITIDSPSGSKHVHRNASSPVLNNYSEAIRITERDPEDCTFIAGSTCNVNDVLNPGESCTLNTVCPDEGGDSISEL